jgi:hypothetical protein
MGVITRWLAGFTETPEYRRDLKAYDVQYRTPNGDRHMALLVGENGDLSTQIRDGVFESHPEATDYTFQPFDYLQFQGRAAMRNLVDTAWQYAGSQSDNL